VQLRVQAKRLRDEIFGAKQMHLPGGGWEEARPWGSWAPLQGAGSRRNTAEDSVDSQKTAGCLPRLTMHILRASASKMLRATVLIFGRFSALGRHTPLAALTSLGSAAVHNK